MKIASGLFAAAILFSAMGCDVQSGMSRKSVEKYTATPTPTAVPVPTPTPPDAADVIKVDTSVEGPTISIDKETARKTAACGKYERVVVNTLDQKITVTGACRQIMVNGRGNEITIEAASTLMINGNDNTVRYSKFVNGAQPMVSDNGQGNIVENAPAPAQ